jgi:HSP20 family protein
MTPIRRTWFPEVFFSDLFNDNTFAKRTEASPALNIVESEKGFRVEVAVPGIAKEAIKIDLNKDNELVISGEKKMDSEEKQEHYLRKEFACTQFVKTLTLPDNIDKDAITATCADGVLSVEIPRKATDVADEIKSITIA